MTSLTDRVGALEGALPHLDPGVAQALSRDNPTPAVPTEGPNRLTFYVPQYSTVWSLGQASDTWDTSVGIVGKTDPNVYFETTGAPKTAESLGTSGKGSAFIGVGITGYMLRTEGNAFRHADKQHYYTTSGGDMVLNADQGSAVLQSDAGKVEINAGDSVSIKAAGDTILFASALSPCDVQYAGAFTHQDAPEGYDGEKQAGAAELFQSCLDFVLACVSPLFEAVEMAPGKAASSLDKAALVTSGAKILASTWGVAQAYGLMGGFLEGVKLEAKNDIGLGAGVSAMLGGTLSAAATGKACASMIGSVSAVVGLAYSAVWGGLMAGMRSRDVRIASQCGDVCVQSKTGTSIAAGTALRLQSAKNIQLNTDRGKAVVYGRQVYVGAASKYGLVADGGSVQVGAVSSPTNFGAPSPKSDNRIKVDGTKVEAAMTADSKLTLDGFKAELKHGDSLVKISAMGVDMFGKGKVILKPT